MVFGFSCDFLFFFEDKEGRMWMPTNNGLVNTQKKYLLRYAADSSFIVGFNVFKKSDGLPTSEFNGGCNPNVIRFEDGILSISSLNGIVQFNPDEIIDGSLPLNIFIKKIPKP